MPTLTGYLILMLFVVAAAGKCQKLAAMKEQMLALIAQKKQRIAEFLW